MAKPFLTYEQQILFPESLQFISVLGEKIKISMALESRMVNFSDLLLMNSMSLGRFCMLRVDVYVHDRWFDTNQII